MKKGISIFFVLALLLSIVILPVNAAAPEVQTTTEIIHTEYGDIEVETILVIHNAMLLNDTKSADKIKTYSYQGTLIGEVTLSATFGYDGQTAWVEKTSSSHSTYDGWSYSEEEITTSIGTSAKANLTARITKFLFNPINVDFSITCTKDGKLS